MTATLDKPTTNDKEAWRLYWEQEGYYWREEPEISDNRQKDLAKMLLIKPDIEQGKYPFAEVELERADLEWLLVSHKYKNHEGPIDWNDFSSLSMNERRRRVRGIDLRGAILIGKDLSFLPLAMTRGSLSSQEWKKATPNQREKAAIHLEFSRLFEAHLEEAALRSAHFEGANLSQARLNRARLTETHFEGANLNGVDISGALCVRTHFGGVLLSEEQAIYIKRYYLLTNHTLFPAKLFDVKMSSGTDLQDSQFCEAPQLGSIVTAGMQWENTSLARIDWSVVKILGDERIAREPIANNANEKVTSPSEQKDKKLANYQRAVRAYRRLSLALRAKGINEYADYYAYRALFLNREVLKRQGIRRWIQYATSLLLDVTAGYGYRPGRTFSLYIFSVVLFMLGYFFYFAPASGQQLSPLASLVFSVSSFHGRGFLPAPNIPLDAPLEQVAEKSTR